MKYFIEQYRDIRKPDGEFYRSVQVEPISKLKEYTGITARSKTLKTVCVFIIKLKKSII